MPNGSPSHLLSTWQVSLQRIEDTKTQDLLVACRLVDMLLGTVVQVQVDEKLTLDDRFDDLSTVDIDGHRERTQFKHTENADRPLSLGTFTTDARSLRLDLVVASILADRSGPGRQATSFAYRILFAEKSKSLVMTTKLCSCAHARTSSSGAVATPIVDQWRTSNSCRVRRVTQLGDRFMSTSSFTAGSRELRLPPLATRRRTRPQRCPRLQGRDTRGESLHASVRPR